MTNFRDPGNPLPPEASRRLEIFASELLDEAEEAELDDQPPRAIRTFELRIKAAKSSGERNLKLLK